MTGLVALGKAADVDAAGPPPNELRPSAMESPTVRDNPCSGAREEQRAPEPSGTPLTAKTALAAGYLSPVGVSSPVSIGSSNAADQLKWGELSGAPVTGS
ncbi:phospholipase C, phosphocholine-specific [Streptomyces hygroscopicus]|nr:phospholipase C, phosphocholine-specific [Streptomyces hygroscopicus]